MPDILSSTGSGPATHALVIGVSRYRHLADGSAPTARGRSVAIRQLTSAARSASEFAGWLLEEYRNPDAPLSSLRLLLSPSNGEQIHPAVLARWDPRADYAATLAAAQSDMIGFRGDCDRDRDNVGIVYVAGHGVQLTKRGAVVLLEDFGSDQALNLLSNAIDVTGCHEGMNHAETAKTQFWFVDACRQRPEVAQEFESLAGALTLDERPGTAEVSPMILAAQTREAALARVGGTSLFNEALLWALRGGAAQGGSHGVDEWHVPAFELFSEVKARVAELAGEYEEEQNVDPAGRFGKAAIHRFAEPPLVNLHVQLYPTNASPAPLGSLLLNAQYPVVERYSSWPLEKKVQAGIYLLTVEPSAPWQRHSEILELKPFELERIVELQ
jgi:hypothetical protein